MEKTLCLYFSSHTVWTKLTSLGEQNDILNTFQDLNLEDQIYNTNNKLLEE